MTLIAPLWSVSCAASKPCCRLAASNPNLRCEQGQQVSGLRNVHIRSPQKGPVGMRAASTCAGLEPEQQHTASLLETKQEGAPPKHQVSAPSPVGDQRLHIDAPRGQQADAKGVRVAVPAGGKSTGSQGNFGSRHEWYRWQQL